MLMEGDWEAIENAALSEALERLQHSLSIETRAANITDITFSLETSGSRARLHIVSDLAYVREVGAPGLPPRPVIAKCIADEAPGLALGIAATVAARGEKLFS
jgi:hypothetical protein